jgi:capsular exopolysaccharide synthesis family protein
VSRIYDALKKAERRQASTPAVTPVDGRAAPDMVWDLEDTARIEYERIQVWITNRSPEAPPIQAVMVASCQRGSGATTTAGGLAGTLAKPPTAKVLIVDANLRTPSLDLLFDARQRRGFSELLSNGDGDGGDFVQPTTRPNLFVLTAGGSSGPLEIFSPAALSRLVTRLKSRFDFIVFDTSPLLEFPDAYALAPHVDAVLMVVEADGTLVDDARRVMRQLERSGARAAGIILNRRRDYTPPLLRRALHRVNGSRTLHP